MILLFIPLHDATKYSQAGVRSVVCGSGESASVLDVLELSCLLSHPEPVHPEPVHASCYDGICAYITIFAQDDQDFGSTRYGLCLATFLEACAEQMKHLATQMNCSLETLAFLGRKRAWNRLGLLLTMIGQRLSIVTSPLLTGPTTDCSGKPRQWPDPREKRTQVFSDHCMAIDMVVRQPIWLTNFEQRQTIKRSRCRFDVVTLEGALTTRLSSILKVRSMALEPLCM